MLCWSNKSICWTLPCRHRLCVSGTGLARWHCWLLDILDQYESITLRYARRFGVGFNLYPLGCGPKVAVMQLATGRGTPPLKHIQHVGARQSQEQAAKSPVSWFSKLLDSSWHLPTCMTLARLMTLALMNLLEHAPWTRRVPILLNIWLNMVVAKFWMLPFWWLFLSLSTWVYSLFLAADLKLLSHGGLPNDCRFHLQLRSSDNVLS